jgi:hypothetical protein
MKTQTAKKTIIQKSDYSEKNRSFEKQFSEVSAMIIDARKNAFRKVNSILVGLYWKLGEYISRKMAASE